MNVPLKSIAIDYMINAPCNLKCPFCYGPPPNMKGELNLEQKIELIQSLKNNGIDKIVIAGGEPLLCNDITDFIKFAYSIGVSIGIQTNAFFKNKLEEILEFIEWAALPLDGISLKSQIKMRTSDEHYSHFKEAIQLIKSFQSSGRNNSLKIKVGTVVSKYNVHEIEEMGLILSNLNIDVWKLYRLRKRGKGIGIFDDYNVSDIEVEKIITTIKTNSPSLNIYYSTDNLVTDSYVIIDPDSSTYVIKGGIQHKVGRLILDSNKFNTEAWSEIIEFTNFQAMANNISKSFPKWHSNQNGN